MLCSCDRGVLTCAPRRAEILGVIMGAIFFGSLIDNKAFGRRKGLLTTTAIMLFASVCLASTYMPTQEATFIEYQILLCLFAIGVGGVYPVTSAFAAEDADEKRGKSVLLTFAMQGAGNVANVAVLLGLMIVFGLTAPADQLDPNRIQIVWHLVHVVAALILAGFLAWVYFHKEESHTFAARDPPASGYRLFYKKMWSRIVGTSVPWFVWDVTFYGNKLFQGSFIIIIHGAGITPFEVLQYTFFNSLIALAGYYVAACTVDKPWMGRRRMQVMGFVVIAAVFLACALWFDWLRHPDHVNLFQALYVLACSRPCMRVLFRAYFREQVLHLELLWPVGPQCHDVPPPLRGLPNRVPHTRHRHRCRERQGRRVDRGACLCPPRRPRQVLDLRSVRACRRARDRGVRAGRDNARSQRGGQVLGCGGGRHHRQLRRRVHQRQEHVVDRARGPPGSRVQGAALAALQRVTTSGDTDTDCRGVTTGGDMLRANAHLDG